MIDEDRPNSQSDRFPAGYFLLIAAVGFLAAIGYGGYVLYPRFDLPAVEGVSLLLLAMGAGVASFFSPCVFPLLLTLLAREASDGDDGGILRPATFALLLSAGATTLLLISGTIIALGGSTLLADFTFASIAGQVLRLAVGAILILLGLVQLGILPAPFKAVERLGFLLLRPPDKRRGRHVVAATIFLFGFGYLLAGFC